ncbi:SusC/RagA family TonB-linked outer membrane protein [Sinomicrobium soli]|nr:SusC/RagA family TonB-linked outer membrane protein [Sinomicrobium sp. N-1-3-6]
MQSLFGDDTVTYEITGNHIVLKPKPQATQKTSPPDTTTSPPEPQQHINGTVSDSNGFPLPGVNVLLKGKRQGTFSNEEGHYSIRATAVDTLMFTYVGFKRLERAVGNTPVINVTLEEDVTSLGEVVVNAGYYSVKERERTGSIVRVTAKDIEMQPVSTPLQSLQGRMAGVEVTQLSGVPGAWTRIRIRGQNSMRGDGNYPLYIIDGVPVASTELGTLSSLPTPLGLDPLNTLNLNNIESIEVLKDADATAIYGSRGANGVVLITTKKGKGADETMYDFNLYTGVGKVSNTMDMLNTEQYLEMRREAFANDGIENYPATAYDVNGTWDQNRYTDWQKELIGGTANITHLDGSVSGGSARTSFLLGGSYHKETTVFPGDFGYHKLTGNLNLNHRSKDNRFRATLSINYGVDKHKLFNNSKIISEAIWLPPNAPSLYDEHGDLRWWENSAWANPLAGQLMPQDLSSKNMVVNTVLNYNLLKDLDLKVSAGYTDMNTEDFIKEPIDSYAPIYRPSLQHRSQYRTTKRNSWIVEPQILYSKNLGKGKLDALLGTTFQKNTSETLLLVGTGYVNKDLIGNLTAADLVNVSQQDNTDYAYTAIFGRIGYNWKQKYFINLTGRRDGSSRFGPENRFGNFGAVGAAWIFSEEDFFKKSLPFINFGKLRGSYGTTGNDQIPDYGYYAIYQPYRGTGELYPSQLANPDYGWEVNKKLEMALDIGLLNDRIRTGVGWYYNRSSNQLIGYALPGITGFSSVQANMPATVRNTGWELEVYTQNIKTANFSWDTSFNITWPQNTLVKYDGIEQSSYANQYRVGKPLNIALVYEYTGIDPETGLYQVRDVNEDGRYDYDDRILTKTLGRKYYGGINNSIRYKNFQLDVLLEFVRQTGVSNQFIFNHTPGRASMASYANVSTLALNRWQAPGDGTKIQKYTTTTASNRQYTYAKNSDIAYNSDASFMRLKTLSLSYTFPGGWISKIGMKACKVYLHAQNLFTLTHYLGLDPQYPGSGITALPSLRMFTGGIQLKF